MKKNFVVPLPSSLFGVYSGLKLFNDVEWTRLSRVNDSLRIDDEWDFRVIDGKLQFWHVAPFTSNWMSDWVDIAENKLLKEPGKTYKVDGNNLVITINDEVNANSHRNPGYNYLSFYLQNEAKRIEDEAKRILFLVHRNLEIFFCGKTKKEALDFISKRNFDKFEILEKETYGNPLILYIVRKKSESLYNEDIYRSFDQKDALEFLTHGQGMLGYLEIVEEIYNI